MQTQDRDGAAHQRPWWTDAVIYEIYLRSFADSDDDGVGDLGGVAAHLEHLVRLGVDAVWITPFFPSPGHDHGYDVSDFTAVDPLFGDLGSFDKLVETAHERGLRVLVDVVPNHTSHEHPWFRAAKDEGRDGGPYRDYYLWRDPAPDGGPPNNWQSNFGGPAWTWDAGSGQYYHHSYLPEQPDLNWRDPRVMQEWAKILRYWIDRGADGFRIDVAHNLLKHEDFPDNPVLADTQVGAAPVGRVSSARRLRRLYDVDQDDAAQIFARLRSELPVTSTGEAPLLLGETVLEDPVRVARYIQRDRLDCAMWFGTDSAGYSAREIAEALSAARLPSAGVFGWFLSNHDRSRPATRFGSADRALAVAAVVLTMPGPYLLYQGEELGAVDLRADPAASRDPIAVRAGEPEMGRDRARAPMPWQEGTGRGFSDAEPWLAHGPLPPAGAAETQEAEPESHLHRWRAMLTAWRLLRHRLPRETTVETAGEVLTVQRGPLRVIANLGPDPVTLGEHGHGDVEVRWRSHAGADSGIIPGGEVVWTLPRGDWEEKSDT